MPESFRVICSFSMPYHSNAVNNYLMHTLVLGACQFTYAGFEDATIARFAAISSYVTRIIPAFCNLALWLSQTWQLPYRDIRYIMYQKESDFDKKATTLKRAIDK